MKKITLFAVAALALSFASCKKDRTCECTYTSVNGTNTSTSSEKITYKKIKKADAKLDCQKLTNVNSNTNSGTTTSGSTTTDCKLK